MTSVSIRRFPALGDDMITCRLFSCEKNKNKQNFCCFEREEEEEIFQDKEGCMCAWIKISITEGPTMASR